LNFFSHYPISQKRGIIAGLVDRVILLSNPKFHFDNFCFVIKILLKNDYPLEFIFDNINQGHRTETETAIFVEPKCCAG